jgi:hypothetical protein
VRVESRKVMNVSKIQCFSFIFVIMSFFFSLIQLDSRSKGLKELNYVLYPKVGALRAALDVIQKGAHHHANQTMHGETPQKHNRKKFVLHDVTIAYKDYNRGERPSEMGIVTGNHCLDTFLQFF